MRARRCGGEPGKVAEARRRTGLSTVASLYKARWAVDDFPIRASAGLPLPVYPYTR